LKFPQTHSVLYVFYTENTFRSCAKRRYYYYNKQRLVNMELNKLLLLKGGRVVVCAVDVAREWSLNYTF
jgi:hypothetical protein